MSNGRRLQVIRWSDRLAFTALALAVLACVLWEHPFWLPTVSVRSCGGNFELVREFSRDFERRHRCRVQYVAAPVQFLLELAVADERHLPEAMVGRSGPGWALLQKQGRLAGAPRVFAVDPLVIVTPKGNPARVRTLADLGRDGVRVLSAPDAMRPKGRVIGALMADVSEASPPGLVDRWERNTVEEVRCGRLLARRLRAGVADAAILARSQTAQPPLLGPATWSRSHRLSSICCAAAGGRCRSRLGGPYATPATNWPIALSRSWLPVPRGWSFVAGMSRGTPPTTHGTRHF